MFGMLLMWSWWCHPRCGSRRPLQLSERAGPSGVAASPVAVAVRLPGAGLVGWGWVGVGVGRGGAGMPPHHVGWGGAGWRARGQ